jgi:hypothetical protein
MSEVQQPAEGGELLSDEQIKNIPSGLSTLRRQNTADGKRMRNWKAVAQTQLAHSKLSLYLWGLEPCPEHIRTGGVFTRRECPECWKTLLCNPPSECQEKIKTLEAEVVAAMSTVDGLVDDLEKSKTREQKFQLHIGRLEEQLKACMSSKNKIGL